MAIDLAYDEGGKGNILLVSMQLAQVERAKKLKKIWRRKLKGKGIEYFHSKEFSRMAGGVFKGLDSLQRLELLTDLSTLIHRRVSTGITFSIDVEFYNRLTTQPFRSRWGSAYTFCISMLAMSAYLYCTEFHLGLDVNILIEDGHRNSAQALQVMQDAKKMKGKPGQFLNILTAALGSKKDHPILQAADMLAYSNWQHIRGGDATIYNALHIENSKYKPTILNVDEALIKSITDSADNWIAIRKELGRRVPKKDEDKQRGIPEVQPSYEHAAESATQRDQSQTRRGEESKKAEA